MLGKKSENGFHGWRAFILSTYSNMNSSIDVFVLRAWCTEFGIILYQQVGGRNKRFRRAQHKQAWKNPVCVRGSPESSLNQSTDFRGFFSSFKVLTGVTLLLEHRLAPWDRPFAAVLCSRKYPYKSPEKERKQGRKLI